jgi:hypothetical protein
LLGYINGISRLPICGSHKLSNSKTTALTTHDNHGWQVIHAFFGVERKPPPKKGKPHPWYSQVGQDQWLVRLFQGKANGFFVELAANDALELSNSYVLEHYYNWTGLCIEPNPMYWYGLTRYRSCRIVAAVVGGSPKALNSSFASSSNASDTTQLSIGDSDISGTMLMFNYEKKRLGGIAASGFDVKTIKGSQLEFTVSLSDIFRQFQVPRTIDYMSLDVEGAEGWILDYFFTQDMDQQFIFKVLTLERPKAEVRQLLYLNGYEYVNMISDFSETLWVHQSTKNELDPLVLEEARLFCTPKRKITNQCVSNS